MSRSNTIFCRNAKTNIKNWNSLSYRLKNKYVHTTKRVWNRVNSVIHIRFIFLLYFTSWNCLRFEIICRANVNKSKIKTLRNRRIKNWNTYRDSTIKQNAADGKLMANNMSFKHKSSENISDKHFFETKFKIEVEQHGIVFDNT